MRVKLLILGGTTEASALARAVAERGLSATLSYAGRVERPRAQPIPVRTGGFGGADGLADWLRAERITHLIDATHPFAARISRNASAAARIAGVRHLALTRPAWSPEPGDRWARVPDIAAAVAALGGPPQRIMLAIGRMHLAEFADRPQHHYLLRLVDEPTEPPPLPDHTVIVDRGPFTEEADRRLLQTHQIGLIVSKNAGGNGARSKITAARTLGLQVLMIDRPALPPRAEVTTVREVLAWIGMDCAGRFHSAHRGV